MAGCDALPKDYIWQNCEDYRVPDNSVWYGKDDDGSDIFCGKAWFEGDEVPAKLIPNRRECRINNNGCEKIVTNCRKVLICAAPNSCHRRRDHCDHSDRNSCQTRRDHCHRRRHHRDDSSSSDSGEDSCTTSRQTNTCNNESKVSEKRVKSCSSATTVTVKKSSKNNHKKREARGEECWYERRIRTVPRIVTRRCIQYIPRVWNERTVRYVQESYAAKVCRGRRCEPCEPCEPCCEPCKHYKSCRACEPCQDSQPCESCDPCDSCDPCEPCDPCRANRRNKTILYSTKSGKGKSTQRQIYSRKSTPRKVKWF